MCNYREGDSLETSYALYKWLAQRAAEQGRPLTDAEVLGALSLSLPPGPVVHLETAALVAPGPAPRTGDAP